MSKNIKEIVYVAPSYEDLQHDHLEFNEHGECLVANFHSNVSLMMRLDSLQITSYELDRLRSDLRESAITASVDTSDKSDSELISSVPSRYISSLSEQEAYLKMLAKQHKESVSKMEEELTKRENEEKEKNAEEEFSRKFAALFSGD
jgi:hypothetical protein